MTSLPLVRTEYFNFSTDTPRTGATGHGESLIDMESYVLPHDQIGSSTLHTWGVADGLTVAVVPDPVSLTIEPGVALDGTGRLICLATGGFAIVDPTVDPTQMANVPTMPVAAGGVVVATGALTGDQYLTMTWREVLDPSASGNAPTLIHAPWLRLQPLADVSDTGDVVVLAHVVLDNQSQVASITADHRRLAGVPAGRLELRRARSSVGPPLAVDHLPAGEIRATDSGGLAVNLLSDSGTTQQVLAIDPSGRVGIGLLGNPPQQTLHVEGSEVHSGGTGGGFSFASRTTGSFVENPTAGERWSWYASGGSASLWSGTDQLTITPGAGGLRLSAGAVGSALELRAGGGSLGKLALTADMVTARRSDGSEPIVVDTRNGRIGQGTGAPSHPVHVTGNTGIRQNSLYLGGTAGWSSLTYNAYHNDANDNWIFPDATRSAVTVEIDDNGNTPRFQVWTTTPTATQAWQMRLGIDGKSGAVTIPGSLAVSSPISVTSNVANTTALNATNNVGTAFCAISNSTGTTAAQVFAGGTGLFVSGSPAASFVGDVHVSGTLSANTKQFLIDHPLDPENRILVHAGVESNERAVVYSGNVSCDESGNASVPLPDWLEALAADFRYQLTCIGGRSDVYVSREVRDGGFGIAGGSPGQRVSWQVTGVRQDAWARTHELVVEEDKPAAERGQYLSPEAFGKDMTASVYWVRQEDAVRRHPVLAQRIVRRHADLETQRLRAQQERCTN